MTCRQVQHGQPSFDCRHLSVSQSVAPIGGIVQNYFAEILQDASGKLHMALYTAGYEGLTFEAFLARLKLAQIDKVLDVREYPVSRKPGFSKKALTERLRDAGIAYEHSPPLGCPKPIRNRYKVDGDWAQYAQDFRTYVSTLNDVLLNLAADSSEQRICMVCYEADPSFCHRSLIAEAVQKLDTTLETRHLPLKIETFADLLRAVA